MYYSLRPGIILRPDKKILIPDTGSILELNDTAWALVLHLEHRKSALELVTFLNESFDTSEMEPDNMSQVVSDFLSEYSDNNIIQVSP